MMNEQQQLAAVLAHSRQTTTAKPLLEFKAGILNLDDRTLRADPRRGKVVLTSEGDGILNLKWLLRPTNAETEVELMLFKDSAQWTKIEQCKDGRVYKLAIKDTNVSHFFWLQEEDPEKDAEIDKRFTLLLNNPNAKLSDWTTTTTQSTSSSTTSSSTGSSTTQNQSTHNVGSTQSNTSAAATTTSSSQFQSQQVSSASTSAATATVRPPTRPAATEASQAATTTAAQQQSAAANPLAQQFAAFTAQFLRNELQPQLIADPTHNLSDILDADRVSSELSELDEKSRRSLLQYLPENQRDLTDLLTHLRSAQFQSTAAHLNSLLNSAAQYGSVMQSMGLPLEQQTFGVEGFIKAIQKEADKNNKK